MKERGTVKNVGKDSIAIEIVPPEECSKCSSCGAAKSRIINVDPSGFDEDVRKGDHVTVDVGAVTMMKVYALLYMIPLTVFVVSLLGTYAVIKHPLWSFISAVLATGFVYACVGRYVKKSPEFYPKICKTKHRS
ncbi:MAG: SoxR reducing system RseC family protein [Candidatus Tantalella remota]|nr:SoxR reducing system RseC family protein [Candidatus Tantalella remota]